MPQGNGDPSLVLFGRDITPNQHALAERFVLLDNLYACGEVSGDGWDWSTQGMADAYVDPQHSLQLFPPRPKIRLRRPEQRLPHRRLPRQRRQRQTAGKDPRVQKRRPADPRCRQHRPKHLGRRARRRRVAAQLRLLPVTPPTTASARPAGRTTIPPPPVCNPAGTIWPASPISISAASISIMPTAMPPSSTSSKPATRNASVRETNLRQIRSAQPLCRMESRIPDDARQRSRPAARSRH